MARRVLSVLLLLLTFHLTLSAGDFLCATHGVLAEHDTGTADEHARHATPASGDETWGQTSSPQKGDACDTPARARCCEALTSCTVTIAARDAHTLSWTPGEVAPPRSALLQATSVVTAPDPPPPKA